VEHTLDRELRELRKMSNQNAPQPRDRPSQIDSQQTNIFKQLHTETVKQNNLERRGGENTAVSNILLIKEYNVWLLLEDVDPLKWWRQLLVEGVMIPLVNVVKNIFCIPATFVPSEQIFSKAGHLISKQTNGLKPSNVEMLIFLNKNV
jgi:hypothetical protein